jgi:hypothetical protein
MLCDCGQCTSDLEWEFSVEKRPLDIHVFDTYRATNSYLNVELEGVMTQKLAKHTAKK